MRRLQLGSARKSLSTRQNARARGRRQRLAIEALEARTAPAVDLTVIGPALSQDLFQQLQQKLDQGPLQQDVFLLGNQLSTWGPAQVLQQVQERLAGLVIPTNSVDAVKSALADKLDSSTLGSLLVGGRNAISVQGTPASDVVSFQLTLGTTKAYNASLDLIVDPRLDTDGAGATFRIDGVVENKDTGQRDNQGAFDATLDWQMVLTFGVDTSGFFMRTNSPSELEIGLNAQLRNNVSVMGRMGILPATFTPTPDPNAPGSFLRTGFDGTFRFDLADPSGDNLLRPTEFSTASVTGTLGGRTPGAPATGEFRMTAAGSFLPDVIDPRNYEVNGLSLGNFFNLAFESDLSYAVTYGGDVLGSSPFGNGTDVTFGDLRMDVSPFYTDYIQPIVVKLQEYFEPFKQIVDILESPIPVVGEFLSKLEGRSGPTKVKDLIRVYMQATGKGAQYAQFNRVLGLIDRVLRFDVTGLGRDQVEDSEQGLGTFVANAKRALGNSAQQNPDPNVKADLENAGNEDDGGPSFMREFSSDFSFPILEDPTNILRMILGDPNITLFQFDFEASAGVEIEKFFPLFYGLGLNLKGGIDFRLNVGAGFDTRGLAEFLPTLDFTSVDTITQSVKDNAGKLVKGFYLDDHNPLADGSNYTASPDGTPGDDGREAEVSFTLGIGPGFGINLGVLELALAVTGSVTATIGLDLNDLPENRDASPSSYVYDGRVRLDEFQTEVAYNPLSLFNANGDLTGKLDFSIQVKAGVQPTLITLLDKSYTLFETTILDFSIYTWNDYNILNGIGAAAPPVIASKDGNGLLTLASDIPDTDGTYLDDRNDVVQAFVTGQAPDGTYDVEVRRGFGRYRQSFTGVRNIAGNGGVGRDQFSVYVSETNARTGLPLAYTGAVNFHGGTGNDRLIARTQGPVFLYGDQGDDYLSSGEGNDFLDGGTGKDILEGSGGNDELHGGLEDDSLDGGDGNDLLLGEEGNDALDGGNGNDTVNGGVGDDTFTWRVNEGNDIFVGGGSNYTTATPLLGDRIQVLGAQVLQPGSDNAEGVLDGRDDSLRLSRLGSTAIVSSQTFEAFSASLSAIDFVNVSLGTGADSIEINDLASTGVRRVDLDLKVPSDSPNVGGDSIIVNLSSNDDSLSLTAAQGDFVHNDRSDGSSPIDLILIALEGGIQMQIQNADRSTDALTIRGNGGNDNLLIQLTNTTRNGVVTQIDPTNLIALTLEGGPGDDTLTAAGAGGMTLDGGDDNDLLHGGNGPDILRGGEGNDHLFARYRNVLADGGPGYDLLTFDDQDRPTSTFLPASYTLTAGSITAARPFEIPRTTAFSSVDELTLFVGPGGSAGNNGGLGNRIAILSTIAGPTTLFLSSSGDVVQVGSPVDSSGGTLASLAGDLNITGGDGADRVVIDVTGVAQNLDAQMTSIGLSGLGNPGQIFLSKIDRLDLRLGSGSDRLTVTGNPAGRSVIDAGGGNDQIVARVLGEATALATSPFGTIGLTVEELRIEETSAAETTIWLIQNGMIYARNASGSVRVPLIDSLGADRIFVQGTNRDVIEFNNETGGPQSAFVDGGRVVVDLGVTVLDFLQSLASSELSQPNSVQGLTQQTDDRRFSGRVASVVVDDGSDRYIDYYVTSDSNNSVSQFRLNPSSGEVRFVQTVKQNDRQWGVDVTGLAGASGVSISPDGRFLFVTGRASNALVVLQRDTTTGQLRFVQSIGGINGPLALATHPTRNGLGVVVASDGVRAFSWNTETGAPSLLTFLPATPVGGLTVSPDGSSFYVSATEEPKLYIDEYRFDLASSAFSLARRLSDAAIPAGLTSLAVSPNGAQVYAIGQTGETLVTFNRSSNGRLTAVDGAVFDGDAPYTPAGVRRAGRVLISPDGRDLYAFGAADLANPASGNQNNLALYRRDSANGRLLLIESYSTNLPLATAISRDGNYVAVGGAGTGGRGTVTLYRRDPASGRLTVAASISLLGSPRGVSFSNDSRFVHVAEQSSFRASTFEIVSSGGTVSLRESGFLTLTTDVVRVEPLPRTGIANATGIAYVFDGSSRLTILRSRVSGTTTVYESIASFNSNSPVMAFDPTGQYYYATNSNRDTINVWRIDSNGIPSTLVSSIPVGPSGLRALSISPDGAFAYLSFSNNENSPTSTTIRVYTRVAATGALAYLGASTDLVDNSNGWNSLSGTTEVTASPDGSHVYFPAKSDNALSVGIQNASGVVTFESVILDGQSYGGFDTGMTGVSTITVSPDGASAFVGTTTGNQAVFARAANGSLSYLRTIRGLPDAAGTVATGLVPNGTDGVTQLTVVGNTATTKTAPGSLRVVRYEGTVATPFTPLVDGQSTASSTLANLGPLAIVGQYAYVLDPTANALGVFQITPTGMTRLQIVVDNLDGIDGLAAPNGIAANDQVVYVTSAVDRSVTVFERQSDGSLRILQRIGLTVGAATLQPTGVYLSPNENRAYFTTNSATSPLAWAARNATDGRLGNVTIPALPPLVAAAFAGTVDIAFSQRGKPFAGGIDGPYLYLLNSKGYVLQAEVKDDGTIAAHPNFAQLTDPSAIPTAITLAPDGYHLYVSDRGGTVWIIGRPLTGAGGAPEGLTLLDRVSNGIDGVTGLSGASDLILSPDGKSLFVAGRSGNTIVVLGRDVDPSSPTFGRLTMQQQVRDGSGGASGLAGVNSLAYGPDGDLFAAGSGEGATPASIARLDVTLYPLNVALKGIASQSSTAPNGNASLANNGTTTGRVATGTVSRTLNQPNSFWEVQLDKLYNLSRVLLFSAFDGSALGLSNFRVIVFDGTRESFSSEYFVGIGGVPLGGSLAVDLPVGVTGDRVRVQLLGLNNAGDGILSLAEVQVFADSRPVRREVGFSGPGILKLLTGNGADSVRVSDSDFSTLVYTNGGPDSVRIDRPASQGFLEVFTGDNADSVEIVNAQSSQTIFISGDQGDDQFLVRRLGGQLSLGIFGSNGSDTLQVRGDQITAGAFFNFDGENPETSPDGDRVLFDARNGSVNSETIPDGADYLSVNNTNKGRLKYRSATLQILNPYNPVDPAPVILSAAFDTPGQPVLEGTSLTLDASPTQNAPDNLSPIYAWDIDGDGQFDDAFGKVITLSPAQLIGLGIGDGFDGAVRTIGLRVVLSDGRSDVAYNSVTFDNVLPSIDSATTNATAATPVLAGDPVLITVLATDPAGSLDPLTYEFDFDGDNTFETISTSGIGQFTYPATGAGPNQIKTVKYRVRDDTGAPAGIINVVIDDSPKVRKLSGSPSSDEGSPYILDLFRSGPRSETIRRWTISWGDGTTTNVGGAATSVSHTYTDDGSYPITAVVEDADGLASISGPVVMVNNVAPTLEVQGNATVNEGSPYRLQLRSLGDPGSDRVRSWQILWGDGSASEQVLGSTASVAHTYARSARSYNIEVQASDEDGTYDASPLAVEVLDVAPQLAMEGALTVDEGSIFDLALGDLVDPGDETITGLSVDWGDGSRASFTPGPDGTFTLPKNLKHAYADGSESYTIRVTLADTDGDHTDVGRRLVTGANGSLDRVPFVVNVRNVAPTIAVTGPVAIDEGSTYTLRLSPPSDPGQDTVSLVRIHWGDGTTTERPFASEVAHVYLGGDVSRTITVDLLDEDGEWLAAGSTQVRVNDVPPRIALSGGSASEGGPFTLILGNVTDPGGAASPSVLEYVVDWGDGTLDRYTSNGSVTHVYREGPFEQTVVVDLVTAATTYRRAGVLTVPVINVAPSSDLSVARRDAVAGQPLQLGSILVSDPGVEDTHTVSIDWGDGSPVVTLNPGRASGQNVELPGHAYATLGRFQITVTLSDDDGGTDVRSIPVEVKASDADLLKLVETVINDGGAQRSNIEQVRLRFNHATNIPALIASGRITEVVQIVRTSVQPNVVVTLTANRFRWDDARKSLIVDLTLDGFGASRFTMLQDGRYEIRIQTTAIERSDLPGALLQDTDGTLDNTLRLNFHRLLGDFDGDRVVTIAPNEILPFIANFGARASSSRYRAEYDLDGDGIITLADYALWVKRIGRRV